MKPAAVFLALLLAPLTTIHAAERVTEVCAYGGTASGLLSAIAAAKAGKKVLVVEPSRWLGGMIGGGIRVGRDCAYPEDIGGLTKMMLREDAHLGVAHDHHGQAKLRDVWRRLVEEHGIEVLYEYRLKSVKKEGARVVGIELEKAPPQPDGCPAPDAVTGEDISVTSKVFIDASYEGDLMAKAGVRYTTGRESAREYGESLGGIRPLKPHQTIAVDPYVKPGDPTSGMLPMISPEPLGQVGDASPHFIAYNFRLNGEDEPLGPPDQFRPENYELLRRIQSAGGTVGWPSDNFNRQTIMSGGLLGAQVGYPDADWATRSRIWRDFIEHVKHLSAITGKPALLNHEDYPDTEGFPHQLYVRMGRRMLGPYVMSQADVECKTAVEDSIGLGYYWVDIYPCRIVALPDGKHVATEGEMFEKIAPHPYRIPYRAITPKEDECTNLLVPVCMSASHVAMASIRMEPTYMIMGESAGIAAVQALEQDVPVQRIDPQRYRQALLTAGQVLEWKGQLVRKGEADVVVYGATAAGLAAAIQAKRMEANVIVVEASAHVGGMTTGGLSSSDVGNAGAIGGVSSEFYARVGKAYGKDERVFHFEPKVAAAVFDAWLREAGIEVVTGEPLDLQRGVAIKAGRIESITTESGRRFRGRVFIDASFEGDLMAKAGVKFTVGREPESQYGESLAGIRRGDRKPRSHYTQGDKDHFKTAVDPFVVKGDPASGLLPWVKRLDLATLVNGTGDAGVQAYNYRLCVTDDPTNRVPFEKPEGYRELDHELLLRVFESGDVRLPILIEKLPNRKYDWNSKHAVGTDLPGASWPYPEANHAERQRIAAEHALYAKGCMWTLANHPRVPESIRRVVSKHGWCRDEFVATGGFPPQLYVREGRRMLADAVVTQGVCMGTEPCPDPVALGSFGLDSHAVQYFVNEQGHVHREGVFWLVPPKPYGISWRAIRPKREECLNLVVPSCISASHAAYGSLRMEPVYMALGQAAGTAAVQAIRAGGAVQDVPYEKLRERLLADGARL